MELNDDELGAVAGGEWIVTTDPITVYCGLKIGACGYERHFNNKKLALEFIQRCNNKCPRCSIGPLSIKNDA